MPVPASPLANVEEGDDDVVGDDVEEEEEEDEEDGRGLEALIPYADSPESNRSARAAASTKGEDAGADAEKEEEGHAVASSRPTAATAARHASRRTTPRG